MSVKPVETGRRLVQNTMYDLITPQNIDHYFTFKHIPGCGKQFRPMTFIKNEATFDEAKKWIRERLLTNTNNILEKMEDRNELHILLSGGLDSCITLHCLREFYDGKIISHTLNYTGTWEGKNTDLEYARKLSGIYGTEHYEHIVTAREMMSDMDDIARKLQLPFSGFISPYFASKMLPENCSVFTGDLSDELFGSYKGPREVSTLGSDQDVLKWRYELDGWCVFSSNDKESLYSGAFFNSIDTNSSFEIMKSWMPNTDDKVNSMLGLDWVSIAPDQVFYSPQMLMPQKDVSPFMDAEFIDYVTSLPGGYKVRDGNVKHILKEAFRGKIPDFVIEREKEGFVQPSNYWMFHDWESVVRETVCKNNKYLNKKYVDRLVDEYYSGNQALQYKVWNLFCFMKWVNIYDKS